MLSPAAAPCIEETMLWLACEAEDRGPVLKDAPKPHILIELRKTSSGVKVDLTAEPAPAALFKFELMALLRAVFELEMPLLIDE